MLNHMAAIAPKRRRKSRRRREKNNDTNVLRPKIRPMDHRNNIYNYNRFQSSRIFFRRGWKKIARKDEENDFDDEEEEEEGKPSKKKSKSTSRDPVFVPRAVSGSEMFNIISDKLDMILNEMSKLKK